MHLNSFSSTSTEHCRKLQVLERAALADPHSTLATLDDPAADAFLPVRHRELVETKADGLALARREVAHLREGLEHERRVRELGGRGERDVELHDVGARDGAGVVEEARRRVLVHQATTCRGSTHPFSLIAPDPPKPVGFATTCVEYTNLRRSMEFLILVLFGPP